MSVFLSKPLRHHLIPVSDGQKIRLKSTRGKIHICYAINLLRRNELKMPECRISPAFFALFLSHVAMATLLRHKTKITHRYATLALTNIGERGLIN